MTVSTCRVLGVDDNPVNLEIIEESLGESCVFHSVDSGGAALEWLAEHEVDIVLLDIMMPGLDGYETCRRIRSMPQLAHLKIILLSAKAMTSERLEGYAAGADDYVTKPFDSQELLAKVKVFHRLQVAEDLDESKSAMLTLLSHEIRTPLNGLLPIAEMLVSGTELSEDERQDYCRLIRSSAASLAHLADRSLLWCQLRSGGLPLELSSVNPADAVQEAVLSCAEAAASKGVVLYGEFSGDPQPMRLDRDLLFHGLGSLIDGLVRYAKRGASVAVEGEAGESVPQLRLHCDLVDASAFDADADPFAALAPVKEGDRVTGGDMNLAVGREIMRAFGGDVRLVAEGQSATLHVSLGTPTALESQRTQPSAT
ncbi:MAG: hypothetical protein DHS20C15_11960 [Planctomycetota bacterium]|nr:MAG: hypothetical protein DHS20C15_11960 [Planctomycetota bacterium]